MTTREFIMHLLMNSEMDDTVYIEVKVPEGNENRYLSYYPAHVTRIGTEDTETMIECKPYKEES